MAKEVKVTYLLVDKVSSNLEKINKALDSYENRLKSLDKVTNDMAKNDKTNLGKWAKESGEHIKALGKDLTDLNKQVNGQKRQTLESYNTRIGTMGVKAQTATGRLKGFNEKLEATNSVVDQLLPKMTDLSAANEMLGESSRKSAGHLREQASAMRDLRNSVPAMVQSMISIPYRR